MRILIEILRTIDYMDIAGTHLLCLIDYLVEWKLDY